MEKKIDTGLFNSKIIEEAKKSLSSSDIEKYKKIADEFHGSVNFETSEVIKNDFSVSPFEDFIAYVEESIKSGLHISLLDDNEKELMKETYGIKWWEKFGYIEDDLTDIVTLK